ncbi:porin [Ruegeria lacuscaerulensis]|uniref:porin n=1 Tax=Ruegeria lacuscaerulensis TaxID=55218 RepID=UPI00147FB616
MKKFFISSALSAATLTGAAQAVEFSGGYLNLDYSTFTDTDFGDAYNLNGSAELAFNRAFSTQLDLGVQRFQDLSETATNWTLHGNWHTANNASFGLFYGQEDLDDADFEFYGLEAGFDAGPAEIEGYLGRQDLTNASDLDGTLFGISAKTELADAWELNASFDIVDNFAGALDYNLFAIGASYAAADNAEVYGNVGVAHISSPLVSGSENEAYVSFGVRVNFGNERGTTFGQRGVLSTLPGLPGL